MAHRDSVATLSAILRPENDARPTFLLGAGASFTSGIPTAGEAVKRLAKRVYAEIELGGRVLPENIKTSEWMAWLQSKSWFLRGEERLSENFPLVVEHLLRPQAYRRNALLELVELKGDLGAGYRALSELILRGLAGTVLTTNFDICLPKALNDKRPHIRHVAEVNRGPNDYNEFSLFSRAQIVWLHGKAEQYTDRNLLDETQALEPSLLKNLFPLLDATPLIVVGYRGAEHSIMDSLLGEGSGLAHRQGVYWCIRKGEVPHPNVEALARRLGSNFQYLEIEGFDELFSDLNVELAGVQRFAVQPDGAIAPQFDDQPMDGATWGDVDSDLALVTLKRYSEKLERGEISANDLKPLMRELGLLVDSKGRELPSAGCILLFGRDPSRFFPHAIVSVTIDGKKRRVFGGNLLNQYRDLLEWAESEDVNPTLKVKTGHQHQLRKAYSDRAIVELLVNLLVHRDYEVRRPSFIEVRQNHSIAFRNAGGLSGAASGNLEFDDSGVFEPIAEFSELRNRALCDIFFGINAMERSGTGLTDAETLSIEQGGGAIFAFPPNQDTFVGKLFGPTASAGSVDVARDPRPVGTYVLNVLPFAAMPQSLSHLKIRGTWRDLERRVPLNDAGTFVFESRTGDLWSFAPLAYLVAIFEPILEGDPQEISMAEVEANDVLHRKASWLVRKHFERYLATLESSGLVLEKRAKGPAKRAYFRSLGDKDRIHVYDSPKRKGIRRGVSKKRGSDPLPYFECEGFGYEVVRIGAAWGIRVKPFYMFTKKDGITPLPGYLRTRHSIKRIRFDRNASVDSDLVFWSRFLSQGDQTINLGEETVEDLLLEGSFISFDVQEEGLVTDESVSKNQRPA